VRAYPTRPPAAALLKRLTDAGEDARIVTTSKAFRVRIGHFATRGGAAADLRRLKAKGFPDAFVTETTDER
jgi:hypothetical protein